MAELLDLADGVVVATPTDTHPALVAAPRHGTPALCEKPIAADLAEMDELVAEIEAAGTPVLVGFQRRFDPPSSNCAAASRTGELGPIYLSAPPASTPSRPTSATCRVPAASSATC